MSEEAIRLLTPLSPIDVAELNIGQEVLLSGVIYTARDAAHKKLMELIEKGEKLPFELKGAVIYYVGPSPAKPGDVIGSAGPTTSGRMDVYTPKLLELGLKATIGKGNRSQAVIEAMRKYKAVYFGVTGGVGALLAKRIKENKTLVCEGLGHENPEAIRKLVVEDFPVIVVNDIYGNDLYKEGIKKYKRD